MKENNNLNITILISNNPYNQSSASANRWRTLIEGLVNLGANINLLIIDGYQTQNEKQKFKQNGEYMGFQYKYINLLVIDNYWKIRFYEYFFRYISQFIIKRKILNLLKDTKSIIWTDNSLFGFQIAHSLRKKYPYVKIFLEMSEFLDIYKTNKGNFIQKIIAHKREKFFLKKAYLAYNGIALMTKTLFDYYNSFSIKGPQLLHLPMTVDLERFSQKTSPPKNFKMPYIAFVGSMNDKKEGISILIKAFAKIIKEFPFYKLYLIGKWHYDIPIYLKLINEFNLETSIFWMGEYPRDMIPSIIMNAKLLVLPRPLSKQALGGFPTKLGEYLATGIPVCATSIGEIPNYLIDEESIYFAEPNSIESFANALIRALKDPIKAKNVGSKGKIVAEKYFNKNLQAKILYEFLQNKI
ncbi:MAG TPA: glycosyltransferase family 4 protein [Gallicola sp.]|nr:glycosyltransferase family 4 protein [Gallicola sp.]